MFQTTWPNHFLATQLLHQILIFVLYAFVLYYIWLIIEGANVGVKKTFQILQYIWLDGANVGVKKNNDQNRKY